MTVFRKHPSADQRNSSHVELIGTVSQPSGFPVGPEPPEDVANGGIRLLRLARSP